MKMKLAIEGMSCEHCVRRVKAALEGAAGVEEVAVDLAGKSALVTGEGFAEAALRAAVEEAGYELVGVADA